MRPTKQDARLRFRIEAFGPIADGRGLKTDQDRARFLGVDPSSYSRVARGLARPSEHFVADAMAAFASDADVSFETLFEVEVAAV